MNPQYKKMDSYLLLFRSETWYRDLPEEKANQISADWMDWFARLSKAGVVSSGQPLEPVGKIVSATGGIKDGPFAETKETVGGYFIVNAKSIDEAVEVAKQCPGLPHGVRVEVRPLLEACPFTKTNVPKLAGAAA
jgi:hypothetical protein